MIARNGWAVILLGVVLLNMGAEVGEDEIAQFRQYDQLSIKELKNEGLARYLELRTIISDSDNLPPPGERVACCALKQIECEVSIPSRIEDLTRVHCVSLVSRSLAMAFARNWEEYYILLSRIVWVRGFVGTTVCTDPLWDWAPNNEWLLTEVTGDLGVPVITVPVGRLPVSKEGQPPIEAKVIPRQEILNCQDKIKSGDVVFIVAFKQNFPYPTKDDSYPAPSKGRVYHVYHQAIAVLDQNNEIALVSCWRDQVRGYPLQDIADPGISGRSFIVGFKIYRMGSRSYKHAIAQIERFNKRHPRKKPYPQPDSLSVDQLYSSANQNTKDLWFGYPTNDYLEQAK